MAAASTATTIATTMATTMATATATATATTATMAFPGEVVGTLAGAFNGPNTLGGTLKLTVEVLQKLSAGAVKLFAALQLEPNASRKRIEAITGYKERHMRNLTRELEEAGLMSKQPYQKNELSPEMMGAYEKLVALEVHPVAAMRLVGKHPLAHIEAGVALVNAQKDRLKNPPGYLITWLQGKLSDAASVAAQVAAQVTVQPPVQPTAQPAAPTAKASAPAAAPKAKRKAAPKAAQAKAAKASAPTATPKAKRKAAKPTAPVAAAPAVAAVAAAPVAVVLAAPLVAARAEPGARSEAKGIMDLLAADPLAAKLAYALENATGCDLRLSADAREALEQLYHAGYTHDDVTYYLAQHWPKTWEGRKGEPLTLKALLAGIARSKHALEMSAFDQPGEALAERFHIIEQVARKQGTPPAVEDVHEYILETNSHRVDVLSRYLNHPRYAEQAQTRLDDLRADVDADRKARREAEANLLAHIEALPKEVRQVWATARDLIRLGRDTDTDRYVKELQVLGYDPARGVMTIIAPDVVAVNRLDRGLADILTRYLNQALVSVGLKTPEKRPLSIEIVMRDEILSHFGY